MLIFNGIAPSTTSHHYAREVDEMARGAQLRCRVAAVVACVVGPLVIVGCGGGSSSPPKPPYRVRPVASDVAYAKRVLVQVADLGVEWYPKPAATPPPETCLRRANPSATKTGDSGAPVQYVSGSSLGVRSSADVYKTAAQAHQVMVAYRSVAYRRCSLAQARKSLAASAKTGVTTGSVTMTQLPVTPAGDEVAGLRTTVAAGTSGGMTIYIDSVAVRSGRVIAKLAFTAEKAPFAGTEEEAITGVLAARATTTEHRPRAASLTDAQLTFVSDLFDSYGRLHGSYVQKLRRCNTTSTSPSEWATCVDTAYHASNLLDKGRQMLYAIAQLTRSTGGSCTSALGKFEQRLKTEVSLEFRLHDAISHMRGKSVILALAKVDDKNVPRMLSAADRVQSECLGV